MKSITSKVSRDDMDNARIDRHRTTNPAETDPGMEDFDWGNDGDDGLSSGSSWDSGFGSSGADKGGSGGFGSTGGMFGSSDSSLGSTTPFGGGSFGGGFGGSSFGGNSFGGSPFGAPAVPEKKDEIEEKLWDVLKGIFKGFFTFFGELVKSFKGFNTGRKLQTGKSAIISGVVVALTGGVIFIFGADKQGALSLVVSGLVSVGVGVPLFMFAYDNFLNTKGQEQLSQETDFPSQFSEASDNGSIGGFDDGHFGDEEFDMFPDDESDDDTSLSDTDLSAYDNSDIDFSDFDSSDSLSDNVADNMENVLSIVDGNMGMVTRSYLYQNILNCLENSDKNYDKVVLLEDGSDDFDAWDAIIQKSAMIMKTNKNETDIPYLIQAKDKLFYTELEVKRVSWLKNIDTFVSEIVNICRYDRDTGVLDHNIYGVGQTVGDSIFIKIMKGETAMVSLKDIYKNHENFVTDSSKYMPVILGVDSEGNIVSKDFKDVNSILVTGMPRSGKTWVTLMILAQMMFYLKPSELHFHILDPKGSISDFKPVLTPHIRKFVSTDTDILQELRHIVNVEGARREKIIGDANFVNIWDYKKKNPDVDLPLLYVVIDEVVTLAERMTKEVKEEFQGLLLELVSRLPALGIRIFMIPHIVKDNILKKSITDLIPCRISVMGDATHIEKALGVRNFEHKLLHVGDMAVKFNNDSPQFVHSAVLAKSNESNKDLFDFLQKFWAKLEPESVEGSLFSKQSKKSKVANLVSGNDRLISINEPQSAVSLTSSKEPTNRLQQSDVADLLKGVKEDKVIDEDEFLWGEDD
jgi:hypothetical protein